MAEMKEIRLRAHHLEYIVLRSIAKKEYPRIKKAADEHLANIYGKKYVNALVNFEKKIKPDSIIEIVEGSDYICEELGCVYSPECLIGDFQALTQKMIKRVPEFLLALPVILSRILSKENLEKQDELILKECGLKVGESYKFADLVKIYIQKSPVSGCIKCMSLQV